MNNIRSVWVGWGSLMLAGAGAYVVAKKSINADRAEKRAAELKKREEMDALEIAQNPGYVPLSRMDDAGSPSHEASHDPAPTRHSRVDEGQRVDEKSKFETSAPFRSKKGDRFS
ncbi:MAG: hypothetical protein M1819_006906 [Sarea resinae]|nr:MAG: hypothetical protein M1819_006906 [Sarea resinae]